MRPMRRERIHWKRSMAATVLLVLLIYNILSSRKAKAANRAVIRAQKEEL